MLMSVLIVRREGCENITCLNTSENAAGTSKGFVGLLMQNTQCCQSRQVCLNCQHVSARDTPMPICYLAMQGSTRAAYCGTSVSKQASLHCKALEETVFAMLIVALERLDVQLELCSPQRLPRGSLTCPLLTSAVH